MRSEPGRADGVAFDAIAPAYDAWYATAVGRLVDRLEKHAVLVLVGERTEGLYALALAERGLKVVGVDVSRRSGGGGRYTFCLSSRVNGHAGSSGGRRSGLGGCPGGRPSWPLQRGGHREERRWRPR
jgi:hypothetical protein